MAAVWGPPATSITHCCGGRATAVKSMPGASSAAAPPLTFMAKISPVSRLRTWNTLPKAPYGHGVGFGGRPSRTLASAAGTGSSPLRQWRHRMGVAARQPSLAHWLHARASSTHVNVHAGCRTWPTMRSSSKSLGPRRRRPLVDASSVIPGEGRAGSAQHQAGTSERHAAWPHPGQQWPLPSPPFPPTPPLFLSPRVLCSCDAPRPMHPTSDSLCTHPHWPLSPHRSPPLCAPQWLLPPPQP